MVIHRDWAAIARATAAAARLEQAEQRLADIEQCPALLDPITPWTRCLLLAGHDDPGPGQSKHRTHGGTEWV